MWLVVVRSHRRCSMGGLARSRRRPRRSKRGSHRQGGGVVRRDLDAAQGGRSAGPSRRRDGRRTRSTPCRQPGAVRRAHEGASRPCAVIPAYQSTVQAGARSWTWSSGGRHRGSARGTWGNQGMVAAGHRRGGAAARHRSQQVPRSHGPSPKAGQQVRPCSEINNDTALFDSVAIRSCGPHGRYMTHATNKGSGRGVVPPPGVSTAVRALIGAIGMNETLRRTGLSRPTLARVAARLPCRRGSIVLAARACGFEL